MPEIKGVLFDKDGTLVDVMATWFPVYRELLREFNGDDEAALMDALVAGGYQPDIHNFKSGSMLAAGTPDQMVDIWWPQLRGAARNQRIVDADQICTEKGLKFVTELLPLKPFFSSLRADGLKIGIATNDNTHSAQMQMRQLGAIDEIDFITGFDGVKNPKPAGDMVHAFCDAVGIDVANVAAVGDNSHDIEMARDAGPCYAIGVASGNSTHDDLNGMADVVLDSVADLQTHLLSLKV